MKLFSNKRVLAASLMLNLFLVAGIGGAGWRWWSAAQTAGGTNERGLRFAANELAPDQRRAYRLALRDARRTMAAPLQAARDSRQEVLRLMGAPQFDHGAVTAALARTREADGAVRARVERSVVDFAATLSLDERRRFVAGLERRSSLGSANATAPRPISTAGERTMP